MYCEAIFLGQFCVTGKGAMRLTGYEALTHEIMLDCKTGNERMKLYLINLGIDEVD